MTRTHWLIVALIPVFWLVAYFGFRSVFDARVTQHTIPEEVNDAYVQTQNAENQEGLSTDMAVMPRFAIGPYHDKDLLEYSGYPDSNCGHMDSHTLHEYVGNGLCNMIIEDITTLSSPEPLYAVDGFAWYDILAWSQDERHLFFFKTYFEGINFNDALVLDRDNLDAGFQQVPLDVEHHYEWVTSNGSDKILLLSTTATSDGFGPGTLTSEQNFDTLSVFDADTMTVREVLHVDTSVETFMLPAQLYDYEGRTQPDISWANDNTITVRVVPLHNLEEYQENMRTYCAGIVDGSVEIDTNEKRERLRMCGDIEASIFANDREVEIAL